MLTAFALVLLSQAQYCPDGNQPCPQCCTLHKDPVDLAYGGYVLERRDALIQGSVSSLEFVRHFNTRQSVWAYQNAPNTNSVRNMPKPFGEPMAAKRMFWWHNWFSFVEFNEAPAEDGGFGDEVQVYLRQMGGRQTGWTNCGVDCFLAPRRGESENLRVYRKANSTYRVIDPEGRILRYDVEYHPSVGVSTLYFLSAIEDEEGNTLVELHYAQPQDANGNLLSACPRDDSGTWAPYLSEIVDTRSQSSLVLRYEHDFSLYNGHRCYISELSSGAVGIKRYAPSTDTKWSTYGKLGTVWAKDGPFNYLLEEQYEYANTLDPPPQFRILQADGVSHLDVSISAAVDDTVSSVVAPDVQNISYTFVDAGHNIDIVTQLVGQPSVRETYMTIGENSVHANRLSSVEGTPGPTYAPGYFETGVTTEFIWDSSSNGNRYRTTNAPTGRPTKVGIDGPFGGRTATVQRGTNGMSPPWPINTPGNCGGLECEWTEWEFAGSGAPRVAAESELSVLAEDGGVTEARKSYYPNGLLASSIKRGLTLDRYGATKEVYVATFYRLERTSGGHCEGGAETDKIAEVEGPCFVDNFSSTACTTPGRLIQNFYESNDGRGRLSRSLEFPEGCGVKPLVTTYDSYTVGGKPTLVTDPNGVQTGYTYTQDGRELLTALHRDGAGSGWSYSYDAFGSLVQADGPDHTTVKYCYYGDGSQPPPEGCKEDGFHHQHPVWVARYPYQGFSWLSVRVDDWKNDRLVASRWYGPGPTLEYEEKYTFDGHLRAAGVSKGTAPGAAQHTNSDGLVDLLGRAENEPPPYCMTTGGPADECDKLDYDSASRLTHLSQVPGGSALPVNTFFEYDKAGNPCQVALNSGTPPPPGCDLGTIESDGYQFDDFGNVVRLALLNTSGSLPKGLEIREFDARGNVTWQQIPAQGSNYYTYEYDRSGRVTRKSEWSYVPTGMPPNVVWVWAELSLYQYEYDKTTAFPSSSCPFVGVNIKGRLAAVVSPLGKTFYDYDQAGRLITERLVRAEAKDCSAQWYTLTTAAYSAGGRLGALTAQDRAVQYIYDQADGNDRVSSVQLLMSSGDGQWHWQEIVRDVKWTARGEIKEYVIYLTGLNTWQRVIYSWETDGTMSSVVLPEFFEQRYYGKHRSPPMHHRPLEACTDYKRGAPALCQQYLYDKVNRVVSYGRKQDGTGLDINDDVYWRWDPRGNMQLASYGGVADVSFAMNTSPWLPDVVDAEQVNTRPLLDSHYKTDESGRVAALGWESDSQGGSSIDLSYSFSAIGSTAIREVAVGNLVYDYAYDENQRRRVKAAPAGDETAFTYSLADTTKLLLDSDERWSDERHADDFYVWLGGMPVAVLRGMTDRDGVRLSDSHTDCARDDANELGGLSCGVRYLVSDYSPKPILALDSAKNVVGVAEYAPFGEVNTLPVFQQTVSPYPLNDSEVLKTYWMPNMGLGTDWRANFNVFDTEDGADFVELFDADTNALLGQESGVHKGHHNSAWWGGWAGDTENFVLQFVDDGKNCAPGVTSCSGNNWSYAGVAVQSMEYRRYDRGVWPYFTALRFPGQYHDEETGLNENWNRFFLPGRRYLQPEPYLRRRGYVRAMARRGLAVPTYAYSLNNPLRYTDPSGLASPAEQLGPAAAQAARWVPVVITGGAGAAGGGSAAAGGVIVVGGVVVGSAAVAATIVVGNGQFPDPGAGTPGAPAPTPAPLPHPPGEPGVPNLCGPESTIVTCMELEEEWDYGYSDPGDAMCEFPEGKRRKPKPTTGGPCIGVGTHSNVVTSSGGRLGSIVCCPCCEGPRYEMRCGTR